MTYKTDQENFWATEFGTNYTDRNQGADVVASNTALFSRIFCRTGPIRSLIEFGCNRGRNLQAIANLIPHAEFSAVEINPSAVEELKKWGGCKEVFAQSVLDFEPQKQYDVSLVKGVLIHINPDELPNVYRRLYDSCKKWVIVAEYFNPAPMQVSYRGHESRLFKRDFAGEMLDQFPDLRIVDYGFVWRRDPNFPLDDITWFLLEKS